MENNKKYPVKIATISFSSLRDSILMLDKRIQENIFVEHDYDKADFLITNYMNKIRENYKIDLKKHEKYFEVIVNGVSINTVYKKIN